MRKYSELRSKDRLSLRDAAPLPAPLAVHIETTNVCNFRCVQCPTGMDDYAETAGYYQAMPMDLYAKTISDLRAIGGVKSIKMYLMGEPLLNKNLGRMIAMARQARVADRIEVTSNCSMLTHERAIELLDSGLEYLRISIYSVDDDKHREITNSRFTPAQVLQNVKQLRALRDQRGQERPFLHAEMLSIDDAANQRFLDTYGEVVDEAAITYPHNWNGYEDRDLIANIAPASGIDYEKSFPVKKDSCPFPFYTLAVRANGSVVTCCVDWSGGTTVGDIRTESLAEIWRGRRLLDFQRMHVEGRRGENSSCANCNAFTRSPDSVDGLTGEELAHRWETAFVPVEALTR